MSNYKKIYDKVKEFGSPKFVTPFWQDINDRVGAEFSENFPKDFLLHKDLCSTMFGCNTVWAGKHFDYVKKFYDPKRLRHLIDDTLYGCLYPQIEDTCCNAIHHLAHMTRWVQKISPNLHHIKSVVEWGGGYGRIPILSQKLFPNMNKYTIVDLPAFTALQYCYLSEHGFDINLVTKGSKIEDNKINLVPIGLCDSVDFSGDLFVALWSLGESAQSACRYVLSKNLLKSFKHMLIGTHTNEDNMLPSGNILFDSFKNILKIENFDLTNNSKYIFK